MIPAARATARVSERLRAPLTNATNPQAMKTADTGCSPRMK